jgi:tyrosyl-tRNA synthetase
LKKNLPPNLLQRGVEDVIVKHHLEVSLKSGKKLRVKHGIDPTSKNVHLGRAVVLWKLKEFQDLGHKIVLIIGDFTAQIGDPSDKLSKRPMLTPADIKNNLRGYLNKIGRVINIKKTEVRHNSEWLGRLNFQEVAQLAESFTIRQMIERKNFRDRWEKKEEISIRETLYPLMQGYDSVAIKADLELGGTDQLFNLLAGRKIQERYGQKPQDIMTTKMLTGLDGRKMSGSWGNVINVTDPPGEQYGKVMSMHDDIMAEYFELATDLPENEIKEYTKLIKSDPKTVKEKLALEVVKRYHSDSVAEKAAEEFARVFQRKEKPTKSQSLKLNKKKINLIDRLVQAGVKSNSEARRLVEQGGVRINDRAATDPSAIINLKKGDLLRMGKHRFFKITF